MKSPANQISDDRKWYECLTADAGLHSANRLAAELRLDLKWSQDTTYERNDSKDLWSVAENPQWYSVVIMYTLCLPSFLIK